MMARYGARLVIFLVTHVSWLSHVATQDVADCTWQPSADDAEAGKSELECHLKTLQTGPAVIPQVNYFMTSFLLKSRSTQTLVCWFLILRLIRNQTQESTSIEWIHAQLFLCHSPGLGLTFSQSVLFELWCNRKKVFYLIWQFTNVLICFSQVKSYARLESELTLIFRRLLQHTTTEPKPSTSLKLNYTKKLKKVLVISFKTFDMTFTAKAQSSMA